ncbi:trans-aconitate 2-methyltransferase [Kutzneria sp. 744]|uniref:class I SAM-dependent methyltransferase n=1 Tax=Kutzneria sp. (strain 744) TaxID=345341 RepID=UPI0003EEA3E1|nr:class I SAM-dependent methyltransferase [Kutzneria sp. 744]EWM18143.1 methyltransferase [Kutzneria sp. 744]
MTSTDIVDPAVAAEWLRRWDAQQEHYIPDRELRFTVIGDVLSDTLGQHSSPTVLDLGCGPGSLAARLVERVPAAHFVGIDTDPLLLAFARATAPSSVRFVEARLGVPGWADTAGVTGKIQAAVSTTALHWLSAEALGQLYRDLADLIEPGGVFIDGDHFAEAKPRLRELQRLVRHRHEARAGVKANEDWDQWWDAVEAEETFADLLAQRRERAVPAHDHGIGPDLETHVELLQQAGFREIGTVWQSGDDRVLVAVR